jgi:prepilin-type N-terminal cleavage/methylation domain-containing protein
MSQSRPRKSSKSSNSGFTLIEVTLASFVLAIGLLSAGLLAGQMMVGSNRSKYMGVASTLASEKLEDLNRWDVDDPQVCVPTGSPAAGSLTSDVNQTTTCPQGASANVSYYDDVYPNIADGASTCPDGSAGCFAETIKSVVGGSTTYSTTVHSPTGTVQTSSSTTAPTGMSFHRRWVIEPNSPNNGVRRVTVLVTLLNTAVKPPVTFQMSIVRP